MLFANAHEALRAFAGACAELVGAGIARGLQSGGDDGAVAGAAAEVAAEIGENRAARCVWRVLIQREHRHNEAGSAKAALRTVLFDERALHRVEFAIRREVFDREQLLAVERADKRDATVDRAIGERAVFHRRHHHGASAAVAGRAAFFGAALAPLLAQVIQNG